MKTVTKSVTASELPAGWREEGQFAPDDRVTVTLEAEDPRLTKLRQGLREAMASSDRGESRPFDRAAVERIKAQGRKRLSRAG